MKKIQDNKSNDNKLTRKILDIKLTSTKFSKMINIAYKNGKIKIRQNNISKKYNLQTCRLNLKIVI